ncbi:type I 3-dehydroquinate dehydratase [Bacillaceae bacterium]
MIPVSGKIVEVGGTKIGDQQPCICTPLVGDQDEAVLREIEGILPKKPDMFEWRLDFYKNLADPERVLSLAAKVRERIGLKPLICTIRSQREGGQPIAITEEEKLKLYVSLCERKLVDIIDYELSNRQEDIEWLRHVSSKNRVKLILSYHNFMSTPSKAFLLQQIAKAEFMAADIAKVAVMSNEIDDILRLLEVTLEARKIVEIPLITISMGKFGFLTRMFGSLFGSSVTFAVGNASSAPGQIPIEDLRAVWQICARIMREC